ncbi:RagB/SusD family nutrient uptake outer membrane protein [Pseudochryseolinea flava]|uniref:RagB/SusD family nutrient uptake outer membrane protein n=1 Tax=Pseudochryseolinea flava TaxID=2059302 RepID=A0A364XXV1_9BACT|nr:RagB/SusD family nutrient uptake outer membrane protein [Pseudochryseolinea flava]RAV99288.1 RagB/SusD family nutrient uptake outer membrane protein [Pseudochryseolinea flava]
MKKYIFLLVMMLCIATTACKDEEFMNKEPKDILLDDDVFKDEKLVLSVVGGFYNRYPEYQSLTNWWEYTNFDEAFASAFGDYWRHQFQDYGYDWWGMWGRAEYGYLREMNVFLQKIAQAEDLEEPVRKRFEAEVRFLRSALFFEMTKRMGGVPLILEPLTYDFSGDASYLQYPRAKESEMYDFIISEMDAIKTMLPDDPNTKSRATKGLALAVKARAALYAGSIAKYGTTTPQVTLPNGEVGIPADKADAYYQKVLDAVQEMSGYSLYNKKPDLSDNFANIFLDKANNPEVIFVNDYKLKSGKVNGWTLDNTPISLSEEGTTGGRLNPSLNLAQQFELLDNTFAPFEIVDGGGDPIVYDNAEDIFAGRDARLAGTIIFPGSTFKGKEVDIWAGLVMNNGAIVTGDTRGQTKQLEEGGPQVQVVGKDGPIDGLEFTAQTGFYIRKHLDPTVGAGQIGTQSEVWWVRYRYAEVLLNAAEAAFELGQLNVAADYMNQVRARAGLITPLQESDITFDRIVHERRVELAFEGHQLWDMKRWRIAHVVWDGSNTGLPTNLEDATTPSTQVYGLIPYKIHDPGEANHGKFIYKVVKPGRVTNTHRFRLGNYYSYIADNVAGANPKIVRNPNH